jgi:uncharacterized membrane protein
MALTQLNPLAGDTDCVAAAVSGNGAVAVGQSSYRAVSWTSGGSPVNLGLLTGGTYSAAVAASYDGSIILVTADTTGGTNRAALWTAGSGLVSLGLPSGATDATPLGISGDGRTVLLSCGLHVYVWTLAGGFMDLHPLTSNALNCVLSYDGLTVAGLTMAGLGGDGPFFWTAAGGITWPALPGGSTSYNVTALSQDGSIAAGYIASGPFIWARAGGISYMGNFPGTVYPTMLAGLSSTGTVAIAQGDFGGVAVSLTWTAAGGFVNLGLLPAGSWAVSLGVSSDGSTVVGQADIAGGFCRGFTSAVAPTWFWVNKVDCEETQ